MDIIFAITAITGCAILYTKMFKGDYDEPLH